MCELFGVSSAVKLQWNDLLREFYSHGTEHPHGWGLALFNGSSVSVEKQPEPSYKSVYLRQRLRPRIQADKLIAHIRLATRGNMDYENCHPFVMEDSARRMWTFAHNGTIFEYPPMEKYFYQQEGATDSERILLYLLDNVNRRQAELNRPLEASERFALVDELVGKMAPENKLNLLFDDGEMMYVHTNFAHSLHIWQREDTVVFSTQPLSQGDWEPLPMNTLFAYRDGRRVFTGTDHGKEFFEDDEKMRLLFLDYSSL